MLAFCEKQAAADRKEYLRLDCAIDNPKINAYYDKLRYDYAGTCVDGKYAGESAREEDQVERLFLKFHNQKQSENQS